MARHETCGDVRDVELAERRVKTHPVALRCVELGPASLPALEPVRDASEEFPHGQRPVALDDRQPHVVRGDAPERFRTRRHVHDPFSLAEPIGEHLAQVGEDLPRTPGRLRCVIEALGKWPWPASRQPPTERRHAAGRRRQPCAEFVSAHGCQCRT